MKRRFKTSTRRSKDSNPSMWKISWAKTNSTWLSVSNHCWHHWTWKRKSSPLCSIKLKSYEVWRSSWELIASFQSESHCDSSKNNWTSWLSAKATCHDRAKSILASSNLPPARTASSAATFLTWPRNSMLSRTRFHVCFINSSTTQTITSPTISIVNHSLSSFRAFPVQSTFYKLQRTCWRRQERSRIIWFQN